ncbi:transposase [Streptomyces sp. NPDC004065]|uniref:transposase n=1 Tax=Streptomyces sp. NPDC004065 TaxID=3364689 RepID=UPI00384C1A37
MGGLEGVGRRSSAMELLARGVPVKEVARRVGVSAQTVYRWRRLDGPAPGAAGGSRVEALEREVVLCRRLVRVMREGMPPKGGTR